ncbi:hypothetical protein ACL90Y_10925 [Micrococcus luteus]
MTKKNPWTQNAEPVRDGKTLLPADAVNTAPVVALGLLGGYVTARETGIRPLGGVLLGAAGLLAGRTWLAKGGPAVTAGLTALYLGGFGASHPLAKKIGAWPSVLAVTALAAGASKALVDSKAPHVA